MSIDYKKLREVAQAAENRYPGPWAEERTPKARKFVAIIGSDGYVVPTAHIGAHIAAFHPAQCIALLDEIERLRRLALEAVHIAMPWSGTDTEDGERLAALEKELANG